MCESNNFDRGCNCHHPWHLQNEGRGKCGRERKTGKCEFCRNGHKHPEDIKKTPSEVDVKA